MLEKTYDHAAIEPRMSKAWEDAEAFRAGKALEVNPKAEPYSIVIPPPNVTGSLHMGHALNNTLQDVLARFYRMRGRDVLWQPGTDHAGIATQSLVERQLAEKQEPSRRDLGREEFLRRVWAWKEHSGGTIVNQLKRLGASCDWSRERFTMDEGLSRAVVKVFVDLYNDGLIYKDKRLVNWDPKLQTAISDLEVLSVEKKGNFSWSEKTAEEKPFDAVAFGKIIDRDPNGHLYYFKYPIKDAENLDRKFVVVATTRPETMLGDMAVAVNPEDERWKPYIGKTVVLPLVGREIPILADEHADPEQGSGAVKITPAHDTDDFEVWKRHRAEIKAATGMDEPINLFDAEAKLKIAGNPGLKRDKPTPLEWNFLLGLNALDRFEARKSVVVRLAQMELVEKIEPHLMKVPYGDRSNVVIEPYLTDQWYVDAKTLAQPALAAVREGKTRFVPENWRTVYFQWLENIQPWCISRQLWWGHQIPAWYGPAMLPHPAVDPGKFTQSFLFVAHNEEEAIQQAEEIYNSGPLGDLGIKISIAGDRQEMEDSIKNANQTRMLKIVRDEDVLDTWFSSGLWPFSTLGWPDETPELARYYPTSVLVTGFDIIFFWVARMMMLGLHFKKEVPFRDVYIHALVRDEKGAKMSKSKGNVVDPLSVMDNYGADALRFTMAAMAAQGRDVKLSMQRIEGYRNFATKLWNAARFCEMNGCVRKEGFDPAAVKLTLNRWIYAESQATAAAVTEAIEAYRFNDAAGAVYRFVWNRFCDWYLEFAKPVFMGDDEAAKAETQAMAAWALDEILKLLHPFMPFVTEELWTVTGEEGPARESLLALASWPLPARDTDAAALAEIDWVIDLISEIRSLRSEMNVPPATLLPLTLSGATEDTKARAARYEAFLKRMARLSDIGFADVPPQGSAQFVLGEATMALALAGVIDIAAERERLKKEIGKHESEITKIDARFANEQFVAKAAEEVLEDNRERRAEAEAAAERLKAALQRLANVA
ncbi:valyl-tRNA synthetase [Rhodomicrobium udaipurense JA643]|uniref:Valine--tRNA ligase n=1 Tax=Rhodomicrobium udaipurense TaxID=1202716 RepID=A0A8I1KL55_9HYPH|nr:valine--tRNA ligase [Rhodomicrobium udaipurense]KAI96007.1 valyl-tRNA synthetase [Rhodomicrobium udaipurense JA643]MBJ7544944.1 valine--tRNA ligase [Rhodomicrobium udaipurense]